MHEGGRQDLGLGISELVVELEALGIDGQDPAGHHQRRVEQLFAVVSRVDVVEIQVDPGVVAQLPQQRQRALASIGPVVAHVHVPEVVDLVFGDGAVVRGDEIRHEGEL